MKTVLMAGVVLGLVACGGSGNNGELANAAVVPLTQAVQGESVTGREVYWQVKMGAGDNADAYRFSPPPPAGAMLAILAAPLDRANELTVELLRDDDSVIGGFTTDDKTVRYLWPVDGEFYLRLRADGDAPEFLAMIGVRSIEGRPIGWTPADSDDAVAENSSKKEKAGPLIVALPLREK